jgi:penicillin-insensitive murein endopeptidase
MSSFPPVRFLAVVTPLVALLPAAALSGCATSGFFSNFGSVSVGNFNEGVLRHGKRLPPRGEGYVIPSLWVERGARFGTDEMVSAIQRVARRVRREYPGGTLGVADLSLKGGGDSELHRSHENGRDAVLIFYAVDPKGRPASPVNSMPRYGGDLIARSPKETHNVRFGPFSPRRFDVPRNWALVRALLEDPEIEVEYLFCSAALKAHLLDHARRIGEDPAVIDQAEELLHQPGDSLPHDDHLHLRIYCAADDRAYGCVDRGPTRWWKKRWKYLPPRAAELMSDLVDFLVRAAYPTLPVRGFVP